MRNIEIKAKIGNLNSLLEKIKLLHPKPATIIPQKDTFYNVNNGRLKLREFKDGNAELIFYDRPDSEGPKLSDFEKCPIQSADKEGLNKVLSKAFGVRGEVNKTRQLYIVGQTRIHIDAVDNLGEFIELEVQLRDDQTIDEGQKVANDLMEKLDINQENLLATAYADLLNL